MTDWDWDGYDRDEAYGQDVRVEAFYPEWDGPDAAQLLLGHALCDNDLLAILPSPKAVDALRGRAAA